MWTIRFILIDVLAIIVCVDWHLLKNRSRYNTLLENKITNIVLVTVYQFLCCLIVILPPAGDSNLRHYLLECRSVRIGFAVIGLLLICGGVLLHSFTIRQRKVIGLQDVRQGLLTSGVYRYFRHPIYTGTTWICLGLALVKLNPDGLLAMPAVFAINFLQAVSEERNDMIIRFPAQYRSYKRNVRMFGPIWLWSAALGTNLLFIIVIIFVPIICGCSTTPHLTVQQRREDIQFLADWARDYSPMVKLTEEFKGNPSYEALLPKYLEYAEQAQTNEEFYRVAHGYYDLICSTGHCYMVGESELKWDSMAIILGIIDIDINPLASGKAMYWAKLSDTLSMCGHPPFDLVLEDDRYFLEDDWQADGITIPRGSRIMKVNGMDCQSYQDFLKEETYLRYNIVSKDLIDSIIKERLLNYSEGPGFQGWQIDFLLPDQSTRSVYVPKLEECPYRKKILEKRTIEPQANCTCIELTDEVAYIRIKSMSLSDVDFVFPSIIDKDRKIIRGFFDRSSGKYEKLIIDIRNNLGGLPYYGYENLIRPFLRETVTYRETAGIRRKYLDDMKSSVLRTLRNRCSTKKEYVVKVEEIESPEEFNSNEWIFYEITRRLVPRKPYKFNGDIYVLTNGNTFSAADDYANAVKRIGLAKLVGQNTRGGHAAYIGPPAIRLPASSMVFRVETEIAINPDGSINEIVGTPPDIKLPPSNIPHGLTREALLEDEWIKCVLAK